MNKPLTLKHRFHLSRFIKGEKADRFPLRLNHRRIFIIPSKRGLGFVFLIVLLLLIAFVYNNNLAYMLGFLLASIFFITTMHSFRSLGGLILNKKQPRPVFAGDTATLPVVIKNPGDTHRYNLKLVIDRHNNAQYIDLPARTTLIVDLQSEVTQRGWHRLGPVRLSSLFPLGLFYAWSPVDFAARVLVYPRPADLEMFIPETGGSPNRNGVANLHGDEFYGFQDYQAGDSIRQIHWKAYAKGQGLYSRQYQSEQSPEIWLDFEYAIGDGSEERLSCLCRWILDAGQAGITYGLKLPGTSIPPESGRAHEEKCLEALALYKL